ncbi:glycosyltransferase family 2 protein [Fluviibacterium sp. DFM31]|uniref:Glycosyltransferase family 2 protein n=1 Tax=Meridianimarinicoccus marinus TaxID=3231483 RepID=A0ABV3L8J5_9RHOB
MKTISVVSPCYNEEDNVFQCYETVRAIFAEHLPDYRLEHIFVDNASTDRTPEILREMAAKDPTIRVVLNARNFGVFRSTFNGLRYATGDAVVVMLPVDLQDPPEMIPEFVQLWQSGYDVVAGARNIREEGYFLRNARGLFYRTLNRLSDVTLEPSVGEFQLIDKKVLKAVLSHNDHYPYIRGIIASCGFKRIIVPYTWKARKRGLSKHNMGALTDVALNAIFAFSRAPMRFCTISGLVIAVGCILFALFEVLLFLIAPSDAPRGTMTIIVSLFFLSGIQLLFIGMLGEYITAIHNQVRGGPLVIEEDRLNIDADDA